MTRRTQGNVKTFLQALGLELRRQRLWMAGVAGVLLLATVLGNLSINVARTEFLEKLDEASSAQPTQGTLTPLPAPAPTKRLLTGYTAHLEGFEGAPEEEQALRSLLISQGAGLQQQPNRIAVVIRRVAAANGPAILQVSPEQSSDLVETLATFRAVLEGDEKTRLNAFLGEHPEFARAPAVEADPAQVKEQLQQITRSAPLLFRLLIAVGLVLMMTFISAASLGLEWDLRRAASTLEPWALTPRPTWILYGSQLAARSLISVIAVLACALPTFLMTPEISTAWALMATATLLVFCLGLSALVGMWGLLSTMLFHHRYGRMAGRLLLSPISLGALTMFRLSIAVEAVNNAGQWIQGRLPDQSWWLVATSMTGAGLLMLAGGLALTPLVNARIGRRRQGLRKL